LTRNPTTELHTPPVPPVQEEGKGKEEENVGNASYLVRTKYAAAMAVALGCAFPLGVIAAVRRGTWIDHASMTVALVGVSVPIFWLGPLLAIPFAVEWGLLPVSGRGTPLHLVLPAVTLGAALAAVLARMLRASLLEELDELYVAAIHL
jgi:ABC-type dipeptide/oligopeptide/nickel transport system permease component